MEQSPPPSAKRRRVASQEDRIVVLPGDNVTAYIRKASSTDDSAIVKLGSGLRVDKDQVYATCAGCLLHVEQAGRNTPKTVTYFIPQNNQRYRPNIGDRVVGWVQDRVAASPGSSGGDVYRVHIGGPQSSAHLCNLDFEGATKRNKPMLKPGTLVYARIVATPSYLDPILSCQVGVSDDDTHPADVACQLPSKDWMTDEGVYGILKGPGTCRKVPLGIARSLLNPENAVLDELSKLKIPFEIAVGVNGYVWIHASQPDYTIAIHNAIRNSQVLNASPSHVRGMVQSVIRTARQNMLDDENGMNDV